MTIKNTAREPNCVSSRRSLHGLVQAIRLPNHFLAVLALSACMLTIPSEARAQVNPQIANCAELKDEATVTQADLCSAHIGCRFVLNMQKTCAQAKGYLERLQTAIGEGTRTFFGSYRKEVTPDATFTATLNGEDWENQRKLGGLAQPSQQAQEIGTRVRDAGNGNTLSGTARNGSTWVYYGQVKDGKADGIGSRIFSNGDIQRGHFKENELSGASDVLSGSGSRFVGNYSELLSGKREGLVVERNGDTFVGTRFGNGSSEGTYTRASGERFVGTFGADGLRTAGKEFRADGLLIEEGRYEKGTLAMGTRYDAGVGIEVNLQAAREVAREAAVREAGEKARMAAEIESRRKREEAVRAEQQFQTSLQTMNPGQLFTRADELNAQGDTVRSREALRALINRFPNHSLAATAARQMTGESGGNPVGGPGFSATGTASSGSGSAPTRQSAFSKQINSRYSSICMRNAAKAEQALTAANARRYFGGAVDLDIFDMAKRIAQPCMAYDAKAKWSYDDAEQARRISQCGSGSCPRWTEGTEGAKTRQWFEIFSGEFNKMMANWEGYSRDLDPPGSSSPSAGAGANRAAAGRLSSQQCEAMRQTVIATKVPSTASVTASTETVMFMTKTSLDMIDGGCPGITPQDRQEHQQAYLAAESACNQVQSGGRRCVPQKHTAAVAVSRPPVASAASSAQQSNVISYDPVSGRCIGSREACACAPGLGAKEYGDCPSSRSSSGGGIRTAR